MIRRLRVCVLILLATGCTKVISEEAALRAWHSSQSSQRERREAVSALIPKGTKMAEAERVLGEPTRRERWHGPSVLNPKVHGLTKEGARIIDGSNATGFADELRIVYEFANGDVVCLRFDAQPSGAKGEDRPFVGFMFGDTNDFKLVWPDNVRR